MSAHLEINSSHWKFFLILYRKFLESNNFYAITKFLKFTLIFCVKRRITIFNFLAILKKSLASFLTDMLFFLLYTRILILFWQFL